MNVSENQSLLDIAIITCGSAEAAVELAILNGLSLTDEPESISAVPDVVDVDVVSYYSQKGLSPATASGDVPDLVVTPTDVLVSIFDILQSDEVVVLEGQSFFDLATIYCGSPELAYEFAELNEMAVTDEPVAGTRLKKPTADNKKIATYYADKALQPATSILVLQGGGELPEDEGIGYWAIEIDFVVS